MGSRKSTNEGVLSWLVRWACHAGTRDFCLALAALVGPVQIFFPSPYIISIHLTPSPSKLSRQSCGVACLLMYVSGLVVCLHRSNNFLTLGSKTLRKTKQRDYIFYPSSLFQFFVISAVNELCMYTHVLLVGKTSSPPPCERLVIRVLPIACRECKPWNVKFYVT
jgi:hypothetical protein